MWLVHSGIWIVIDDLSTSPSRTLTERCRLWTNHFISTLGIVISRWWIRIWLELVLALPSHLLRDVSKLFVWIVLSCIGIWLCRRGLSSVLNESFVSFRTHLTISNFWIILAWSWILSWIEFVFTSKIDIIHITAKWLGIIMGTGTKMSLFFLSPNLSHLSETNHLDGLATFGPPGNS